MRSPIRHTPAGEGAFASAGAAADAALSELPEALVLAFDGEMRFLLSAGNAIERLGSTSTRSYRPGAALAEAFPGELWRALGPLCDTALDGETRSREIWTPAGHCLTVDVGPLREDASGTEGPGEIVGGVAVVLDSTARKAAAALAASPIDQLEDSFERAPVGTGLLDRDGRWMMVNGALCEITGYTPQELVGRRFDGILHPEDAHNDLGQRERLLAGEIGAFQVEKRYFDASGEVVLAIVSMSLVRGSDSEPLYFVVQMHDISERREFEQQLRRLAEHDPLTGLRSRRLFLHDLHLQVARSRRYGEVAALMVVGVTDMRELSRLHGRDAGGEALQAVGRAITRRLRQTDLVGRVGAEEFAVLLPHIDQEGAAVVAESLARVIPACAIDLGDSVLHPGARIGFTLIDERTGDAQEALSAAAASMRSGEELVSLQRD